MVRPPALSEKQMIELYRDLFLIRYFEETVSRLYPEQEMRCPVHLAIGQEAVAVGACSVLRKDDYLFSNHRGHAHLIAKGVDVESIAAELYGRRAGCSHGWGGSTHLAAPEVGALGTTATVGGGIPIAVGAALASKIKGDGRVTAVIFGDGAADQGVFQESLNFAALKKLPVVFVCENNALATCSLQKDRQPLDNIHHRGKPFDVPGCRVDGNDVLAVRTACRSAVEKARREEGPSLIECKTYRIMGHVGPGTDYHLGYRSEEEYKAWRRRCPVKRMERALVKHGVAKPEIAAIRREVREKVETAFGKAKSAEFPRISDVHSDSQPVKALFPSATRRAYKVTREITYREAIAEATIQAMETYEDVFALGIGLADPTGVYGTMLGLAERFGSQRALDLPVAEAGMTGVAIGAALCGMRPVMFHMRMDFLTVSLDQIINHAAKWRWMFGGRMRVPLTIRCIAAKGWGSAAQHSQTLHGLLMHVPGLKVVAPATAADAKELLLAAIADDDPVIVMEHRSLYERRGIVDRTPVAAPLGKAAMRRRGSDVTIAAVSYAVEDALKAADEAAKRGVSAEVIDLRSLKPLDIDALRHSAAKTGRLIVCDVGWRFCGAAAGIVTAVTAVGAECFDCAPKVPPARLKSPPRIVALPDLPTPASSALETEYYPGADQTLTAILETCDS